MLTENGSVASLIHARAGLQRRIVKVSGFFLGYDARYLYKAALFKLADRLVADGIGCSLVISVLASYKKLVQNFQFACAANAKNLSSQGRSVQNALPHGFLY